MNIEEIKKVSSSKNENWYNKFEEMISSYYEEKGPSSIPDLVTVFSDDMPSEINFSIIHLIEQTEIKSYVENFLKVFEKKIPEDHEWLDILLIRMMNDNRYLNEIQSNLPNLNIMERSNLRSLLSRMIKDKDNIEFVDRLKILQQANS